MLELIILGIIQGITEWLPISSEGLIFLIKANFFDEKDISEIIRLALFLHLGTFFAALVYFRKEVWVLLKALVKYKEAGAGTRKILNFLIISTIISGLLGILLIQVFESITAEVENLGRFITLLIGIFLLVTAYLQFRSKKKGINDKNRGSSELKVSDGIVLGIVQAFSALPGLSRSGLTVSTLLIHRFHEATALRLSFLMSLPIVLGGNIILNFGDFSFSKELLFGIIASFVFGLLTIDLLLRLARKVNFAVFVLIFAIITIASVFVA